MRTPGSQPIELLSLIGHRVGGEPAPDAVDRPAVPQDSVLRQPADDGVFGAFRGDGQSQAGPAAHGENGPGGTVPQAADHHPGIGCAGLPLLAPRSGADPRQRGLEFRHYVYSNEAWHHVPDSGDRLVQPVRALVAAVEHAGRAVLPGGPRRGAVAGPRSSTPTKGPRLQHRSALAAWSRPGSR